MIRAAVLVALLALAAATAGCGSKQSSGPAWPKSAGRMEVDPEKDGGESLEPQQAVSVAAIEHSDDKTPAVDDDEDAIVVEDPATTTSDDATKPGEVQFEVIDAQPEDATPDP
jgi:hypothetical protein